MVAIFEEDLTSNPKTLCDWVRNFRIKKIQMKRKLRTGGDDLRVCAILSTALISAEHELRRKQQERFNRWLDMQAKFNLGGVSGEEEQHQGNAAYNGSVIDNRMVEATSNAECRRREDITNLWKCEFSGLDKFMRNISNSSSAKDERSCGIMITESSSMYIGNTHEVKIAS